MACYTMILHALTMYDAMATYLSNVDWFYEFSFVFNVDEYWHIFVYHLNVAIESYVPVNPLLHFVSFWKHHI